MGGSSGPQRPSDIEDSQERTAVAPSDSQQETLAGSDSASKMDAAVIEALIRDVLPVAESRLRSAGPLAEGGMGRVDVVVDLALQRRIARKMIVPRLRDVARAVRLFLREAQITGQLDHPAIVPVHDVGVDREGRLFFTMKLVEGESLKDVVARLPEGRLDPQQLQELLENVIKIADALDFAHSRGVIHGDVKPDNVMVGAFGEVYLMDWGLARIQPQALTKTSPALREREGQVLAGTPGFMAPEQALGEPIDERTDVFLLGALIYYCLVRHRPYEGDDSTQVLASARAARWEPIHEGARAVSPDLVRIVSKAMARSPDDRYPSVAELRGELKLFLHGGAEFPRREVAAGEHIIREGENGSEVFVLESGRVQVYQTVKGKTIDRREMGPGEVFGEMAILTDSPRTASVIALEDCVLRVVTGEILEREMGGMKPWLAALTKALARNLREREET